MRVIIIGIDGADKSVLDKFDLKWLKDPHIMESTLPPFSPIAWNSMFTGVTPELHGIEGFVQLDENLNYKVINSTDRKVPALWNKYPGVYYKIPFTYPAEKIDGIMIPGLGSPDDDYGENKYNLHSDRFLEHAFGTLKKEIKELKRLWHKPGDIFACVFRITDILQHYYWGDLWTLRKAYARIDDFVDWVMQKKEKDDVVLIVSDHGFCGADTVFCVNTWLHSRGYIHIPKAKTSKLLTLIRRSPLRPLLIKLLRLKVFSKYIKHLPMGGFEAVEAINPETIAYYVPGSCTKIVVQQEDFTERIAEELKQEKCIDDTHIKDNTIIFTLKEGYTFRSHDEEGKIYVPLTTGVNGTHTMKGICIAHGVKPCDNIYQVHDTVIRILDKKKNDEIVKERFRKLGYL